MSYPLQITYLRNADIDRTKWDACIKESKNSRVYALSVYLDTMCSNWDALITNDYSFVMPLPWRSKLGIHYLYQPAFTQQLGIFSKEDITTKAVDHFLKNIPSKFRFWDIALNAGNKTDSYPTRPAKNYLLPLSPPYEILTEHYNRNAKRNIKKAIDAGVTTIDGNFSDTIKLHKIRFNNTIGANDNDYKRLEKLLEKLSSGGSVFSVCARNKSGSIIASSTYLLHNDRIVFLINGNLPESLETGATHLLKDYVINKFSGRSLVMDFEGSDFPQFAKFYEQFGAKDIEYYPVIVNNKLPWPIRYLKSSSPVL